jgi:hypothetical protein
MPPPDVCCYLGQPTRVYGSSRAVLAWGVREAVKTGKSIVCFIQDGADYGAPVEPENWRLCITGPFECLATIEITPFDGVRPTVYSVTLLGHSNVEKRRLPR